MLLRVARHAEKVVTDPRQARRGFLSEVGQLPERCSDNPVLLMIAGGTYAVSITDERFRARIMKSFAAYIVEQAEAISVHLYIHLSDCVSIWRDDSPEPRRSSEGVDLFESIEVEHRDFVARFAADGRSARVGCPRSVRSIENALRVAVSLTLARSNGVLLHGAGIARGTGASVFFGRSGSGKSTIALLARGRAVLGDDLIALREIERTWYVCSTPFSGSVGRRRPPRVLPLRGLFRLRQGEKFQCVPMSPSRGVAELMQSVVLPVASPDDARIVFERCLELQDSSGVHELTFRIDRGLWRWLDGSGF